MYVVRQKVFCFIVGVGIVAASTLSSQDVWAGKEKYTVHAKAEGAGKNWKFWKWFKQTKEGTLVRTRSQDHVFRMVVHTREPKLSKASKRKSRSVEQLAVGAGLCDKGEGATNIRRIPAVTEVLGFLQNSENRTSNILVSLDAGSQSHLGATFNTFGFGSSFTMDLRQELNSTFNMMSEIIGEEEVPKVHGFHHRTNLHLILNELENDFKHSLQNKLDDSLDNKRENYFSRTIVLLVLWIDIFEQYFSSFSVRICDNFNKLNLNLKTVISKISDHLCKELGFTDQQQVDLRHLLTDFLAELLAKGLLSLSKVFTENLREDLMITVFDRVTCMDEEFFFFEHGAIYRNPGFMTDVSSEVDVSEL